MMVTNQINDIENGFQEYTNAADPLLRMNLKWLELHQKIINLQNKFQSDINYIFLLIILTNLSYIVNILFFKG